MTVEELYGQIGGDYAEAIGRLRSDALVAKFIVKFLEDDSCSNTVSAWAAHDEQAAFEAAHMAKGVCANLSLRKLANLASEITEALRPGNENARSTVDVDALVAELESEHRSAIASIEAFAGATR